MARRRMPLSSGSTFGLDYLDQHLGQSFFGDTFTSFHSRTKQNLHVIKYLRKITIDDFKQYKIEKAKMVQLQHPHIVPFKIDHYIKVGGNRLALEAPYYPAGSLAQRHPTGTIVPLATVVMYVQQIAAALSYAHQSGIVHTNVKPENILLDADEKLLLSDFVLPMFMKRWLTALKDGSDVPRTLYHTAPELLRGDWEAASDQYALAVMVYEWLSGRPPFTGTINEIRKQHRHTPPPPMEIAQGEIEHVVRKALAKQPVERYKTVDEFACALEGASK